MVKTIGVLGGWGLESTAVFYFEIIKQCQRLYGAKYNTHYPEIFIYNMTHPCWIESIKNSAKIVPILLSGIKKLESAGADFIVVPCNTAHYFFEDMKRSSSVPILNIIQETLKKVKSDGYKNIGLLATATTIENKIYDKIFNEFGIDVIVPKKQNKITKIIINILAGKKLKKDKNELKQIIKKLKYNGAEAIVLGCTDLPLLLRQEDVDIKVFDNLKIYAESTVKFAIKK